MAAKKDPASREKKFLLLAEALRIAGCDQDLLFEVASEGKVRTYVISNNWPLADSSESYSGYVEIPPLTLLLARSHDRAVISGGKRLSDNEAIAFKEPRELFFGQVLFSGDDTRTLAAELQRVEPGPKAERNLERTLAAFVLYIAERDKAKFLSDGKPNAKAIAEAVYELLNARGLADSGLSVRAIQDRILKGLKELQS